MNFRLISTANDSHARAGVIATGHGEFETPVFMPVGSACSVKGIYTKDLKKDIKADKILGKDYILYLRTMITII